MQQVKACVFDAYGTLFDVHAAVARHAQAIGPAAEALSRLWRVKQLEYSWVRSLLRRHADFRVCTEDGLDFAMASHGLQARADIRAALLEAYRTLDAYPEASAVLRRLRVAGLRTAILSNGSPAMLDGAVRSAGLADLLDAVVSIEEAGIYKPDPAAYQLVVDRLGLPPPAISFQSSNAWDVAGAAAFGFRVNWINRAGQPSEYGLRGKVPELRSLAEIPRLLGIDAPAG
jgi:2-haloacid dehalogenase